MADVQRAWRDQEGRQAATGIKPESVAIASAAEPTGGLLVEHDHAELYYNGDAYRLTQRRLLINHSDQPVTRYLIRISVERPARSGCLQRRLVTLRQRQRTFSALPR